MKNKRLTNIDLLPCPFCGKKVTEVYEDYVNSFITVCQHCTATSRRMYSPDATANQWNKRN
jgi:Lar family restriction alleviation protein